ncbi:PTS sugar transporter subunit IIA [Amedibacillus sp. YH-ame10]
MKSMSHLLKEENCYIRQSVVDWKEAVHIACAPLIQQNYCTEAYETAVYENTEKFGPYYVICENLALIHASNEKGVVETQMSVTILKEPIKFKPDGYDVRVLVTLVAKDSESHMEGIQAISNIFMDENKVQQILDATCAKQIYELFVSNACEI